jgi:hypothetical protein
LEKSVGFGTEKGGTYYHKILLLVLRVFRGHRELLVFKV